MNKNDTEHFRKKLTEERKLLEKELSATGKKNPDHPGDWNAVPDKMDIQASDENEVADQLESYQENRAILDKFEKRYNEVKDALIRTEKGTYGICKVCGKVIERERLEANAAANTCIEHKNIS